LFDLLIAVRLMQNYVKLLESSRDNPTVALFQRNYRKQTRDDIVGELADRSSPIEVCQSYAMLDSRIWIWVIKNTSQVEPRFNMYNIHTM